MSAQVPAKKEFSQLSITKTLLLPCSAKKVGTSMAEDASATPNDGPFAALSRAKSIAATASSTLSCP
jgi:hypothetical protein